VQVFCELKSDGEGNGLAEGRWNQWLASDMKVKNGKVSFGPMTSDVHAGTLLDLNKEVSK